MAFERICYLELGTMDFKLVEAYDTTFVERKALKAWRVVLCGYPFREDKNGSRTREGWVCFGLLGLLLLMRRYRH